MEAREGTAWVRLRTPYTGVIENDQFGNAMVNAEDAKALVASGQAEYVEPPWDSNTVAKFFEKYKVTQIGSGNPDLLALARKMKIKTHAASESEVSKIYG